MNPSTLELALRRTAGLRYAFAHYPAGAPHLDVELHFDHGVERYRVSPRGDVTVATDAPEPPPPLRAV